MERINKILLDNFYYKVQEKTHSYSKRMESDAVENIWKALNACMWDMDEVVKL